MISSDDIFLELIHLTKKETEVLSEIIELLPKEKMSEHERKQLGYVEVECHMAIFKGKGVSIPVKRYEYALDVASRLSEKQT